MFSRDKKAREGLEEIERRFESLEHDFKMLKLEWEESYEKIASMLRKLARRAQAVTDAEGELGKPLSPDEEALARMQNADRNGQVDSETRKRAMEIVMKRRGMR